LELPCDVMGPGADAYKLGIGSDYHPRHMCNVRMTPPLRPSKCRW
jgi:hypothetical protein